ILAAHSLCSARALQPEQQVRKSRFGDLVEIGEDEHTRLGADGDGGQPVRVVHLPADLTSDGGAGTFLLFDAAAGPSRAQSSNLQALLDVLPIGLALVDRDGRFLTMNAAFRQAGGITGSSMPVYPGD